MIKYNILFTNNTDTIVQVSSSCVINDQTIINSKIVNANETTNINSLDGEWLIDTYITDLNILKKYKNTENDFGYNIGKIKQNNIDKENHLIKNDKFKLIYGTDHITLTYK